VDWSNSGKRIFVSEISPNLTKESVLNISFTPKGFFKPAISFQSIRSFGISFGGSYSFLGGLNFPSQDKIIVYANLHESCKIKLKIIKK
jgi:hypothetical protein